VRVILIGLIKSCKNWCNGHHTLQPAIWTADEGADPETLLTGEGGLSYGAIFSIIDGTNSNPKAVLACR
jgi:hypothetical protein